MSGSHHPSDREGCFKHIQATAVTLQNYTSSTLRQYHLTAATNIMNIMDVLLFSSDSLWRIMKKKKLLWKKDKRVCACNNKAAAESTFGCLPNAEMVTKHTGETRMLFNFIWKGSRICYFENQSSLFPKPSRILGMHWVLKPWKKIV